jgi:hypothetical protein
MARAHWPFLRAAQGLNDQLTAEQKAGANPLTRFVVPDPARVVTFNSAEYWLHSRNTRTMSFVHAHLSHTRTIEELAPPRFFFGLAGLAILGVIAYIALSIVAAPGDEPLYHFGEDGAITALSTVFLSMASALALAVFYLRIEDWKSGALFWLVLAAGCAFLALDEQLMLHERGGHVIEVSSVGATEMFRNWNDVIVIGYGVVALAIAAVFGREILRCRVFALVFLGGFAFYALHTGIDSIVPDTVAWKDIPEESAKLKSVLFLFLAMTAQFLAVVEPLRRDLGQTAGR